MTDADLALAVGIRAETLCQYRKRGCLAKTAKGLRKWREENITKSGAKSIGERELEPTADRLEAHQLDEAEQRAKIDKLEQEARAKQLKNDQLTGQLIYRKDAEQFVSELILRVKHRLESVPGELETEIPADMRPQLVSRWRDYVYLILTEMSQWRIGQPQGTPSTTA